VMSIVTVTTIDVLIEDSIETLPTLHTKYSKIIQERRSDFEVISKENARFLVS